jgi:2'-5' RNA ligase
MRKIKSFNDFKSIDENKPCWTGYKQIGTKKKKGKEVPNCVPVKEEKKAFDYGCSMLYYDFPKINEIHSMIEDEDLYTEEGDRSYGLEKEPHTTLLFGLHSHEIPDEEVMKASKCHEIPSELKLHNPSLFKNDKYDVLKFDVAGNNLHKLNSELSKLPHTTDYPDYHPHSTIGYLKKGTGDKYVSLLQGSEYTVNPSKIVYSKPDGSKVEEKI